MEEAEVSDRVQVLEGESVQLRARMKALRLSLEQQSPRGSSGAVAMYDAARQPWESGTQDDQSTPEATGLVEEEAEVAAASTSEYASAGDTKAGEEDLVAEDGHDEAVSASLDVGIEEAEVVPAVGGGVVLPQFGGRWPPGPSPAPAGSGGSETPNAEGPDAVDAASGIQEELAAEVLGRKGVVR